MARQMEYVIMGPSSEADSGLQGRTHKSLSVRREPKHFMNLRTLYRSSASPPRHDSAVDIANESSTITPTTPHLPLTPPVVDEEVNKTSAEDPTNEEGPGATSIPTTPVNQHSPPTPDDTPPRQDVRIPTRPFLTLQPSMASTRAESFTTALENPLSDDESDRSYPIVKGAHRKKMTPSSNLVNGDPHHVSPLAAIQTLDASHEDDQERRVPSWAFIPPPDEMAQDHGLQDDNNIMSSDYAMAVDGEKKMQDEGLNEAQISTLDDEPGTQKEAWIIKSSKRRNGTKRGASLRERLEDAKQVHQSPSTDKFASIIGWNESVSSSVGNEDRRWSAVSSSSTVEAFVIESPPTLGRKRGTLRHVSKNHALRSTSSPIPDSNRTSFQSSCDSPHRLVHKKARLGNQHRWSDGSDFSRSFSVSSSSAFTRPEVIKVAVIPERNSSLASSANSSRRQSRSASMASALLPEMQQIDNNAQIQSSQRKRTLSESTDKSRDRRYPPQVPPRASSRSAPTSRSTSRANSITSEHFTVQRKKAEEDLRTTLERMESERALPTISNTPPAKRSLDITPSEKENVTEQGRRMIPKTTGVATRSTPEPHRVSINGIVPGTAEWAALRPSTILGTPFSAHSFMSGSPEIVEAKAINLFPHKNDSVQLIEPHVLAESQAVRQLRQQHDAQVTVSPPQTSPQITALPPIFVNTPRIGQRAQADDAMDSPLRNPRSAPNPPRFLDIKGTPANQVITTGMRRSDTTPSKLRKRPPINDRSQSESFTRSIARNFSSRKAKNPKADQELDSQTHPTWRPGAFWDDEDAREARQQEQMDIHQPPPSAIQFRDLTVQNSLGLPQERSVVAGPMKLLRRLSERGRNYYRPRPEPIVAKRSSMSSLDRFRASQNVYGSPSSNQNVPFTKLRVLSDKVLGARSRREEERAERRREVLRKSIGPNITPKGDSRFPAAMIGEDLDSRTSTMVTSRDSRM